MEDKDLNVAGLWVSEGEDGEAGQEGKARSGVQIHTPQCFEKKRITASTSNTFLINVDIFFYPKTIPQTPHY